MCYSLAAREGSLADVDRWTGGQVDRCMEFVLRIEDLHDLPSRYMQTMFFFWVTTPSTTELAGGFKTCFKFSAGERATMIQ